MTYHEQYAIAAATTLAVEVPIVLWIARRLRLMASDLRALGAALLANALTHPALWYLPWFLAPSLLWPDNHALYVVVGEGSALVVETAIYWLLLARGRPWVAVGASALANAASYGVGLVVWRLVG